MPTLRELREQKGWSQETLAGMAGISAHTIGRIERGDVRKPIPLVVKALAQALGVTPDEIVVNRVLRGGNE